MVKRSNAQATAAAKKARVDPALTPIAQVIMESEDLPDRCRTMLLETLPLSLSVTADKRHDVQKAIVDMIEQTLNTRKQAMEGAVTTEDEKLKNFLSSQVDLKSNVEQTEAAVAAQKEIVDSAKKALADATVAANASWTTLSDKQAEHKTLNEKLAEAKTNKSGLEAAYEDHFKPIKETASEPHFKGLEPHLQHLEIESSLLIALPSSCAKSKEERGSFDNVVLEELEKAINAKIAAFGATIAEETPASAAREATIEAAQKDFDAKKAIQKQLAADFEAAQKEHTDRDSKLAAAKDAMSKLQPQIDVATELMEKAKAAFEEFENGTMATFANLRSASSATEAATMGA